MATKIRQVEEVHLARAAVGVRRVIHDLRILGIVAILVIVGAFVYGALFMVSANRPSTALLYVPLILGGCWIVQRLARRRP